MPEKPSAEHAQGLSDLYWTIRLGGGASALSLAAAVGRQLLKEGKIDLPFWHYLMGILTH